MSWANSKARRHLMVLRKLGGYALMTATCLTCWYVIYVSIWSLGAY